MHFTTLQTRVRTSPESDRADALHFSPDRRLYRCPISGLLLQTITCTDFIHISYIDLRSSVCLLPEPREEEPIALQIPREIQEREKAITRDLLLPERIRENTIHRMSITHRGKSYRFRPSRIISRK